MQENLCILHRFALYTLLVFSGEEDIKNGKGEGIVGWYDLDEKLRVQVYLDGEIFEKN